MDQATIREAAGISTATLHEAAGKIGNLPSAIKPLSPELTVCGRALTVLSPPRDNLWLHRAIYEAEPGDVLVVDTGGFTEAGYWGEIMAFAAQQRGIAGLVIDGGVRDRAQMIAMGFPVFSAAVCIRGTGKDRNAYGAINKPIRIGDTVIFPGDLIVGDGDGVMAAPAGKAADIVTLSRQRDAEEIKIKERLLKGESTLRIYGLE